MEDFDFVAHMQQSSVIIRKNGDFEDAGKGSHVQHIINILLYHLLLHLTILFLITTDICVELHWSFPEFLRIASDRLGLLPRAVTAYNIDGISLSFATYYHDLHLM